MRRMFEVCVLPPLSVVPQLVPVICPQNDDRVRVQPFCFSCIEHDPDLETLALLHSSGPLSHARRPGVLLARRDELHAAVVREDEPELVPLTKTGLGGKTSSLPRPSSASSPHLYNDPLVHVAIHRRELDCSASSINHSKTPLTPVQA